MGETMIEKLDAIIALISDINQKIEKFLKKYGEDEDIEDDTDYCEECNQPVSDCACNEV